MNGVPLCNSWGDHSGYSRRHQVGISSLGQGTSSGPLQWRGKTLLGRSRSLFCAWRCSQTPTIRRKYRRETGPPYVPLGKPVTPLGPEPLIPEERSTDFGNISLVRSFQTFTPSFDEIFDWLWSNLSRPKAEGIQGLAMEVPVTLEQPRCGGQARILVPAQACCPTCRGYGGVGP